MRHVITMRDWVWDFYMPGYANIAFGVHLKQWGLLFSWGAGWWEIIALCFQITFELEPPGARQKVKG